MEGLNFTKFLCVALMLTVTQAANNDSTTAGPTTESSTSTAKVSSTPTTPPSTTTPSAEVLCPQHNKSCDDCLGVPGAKCLWCKSDSKCVAYPAKKILPPKEICALDEARWGVCWLNFEALIISMSVVGGVIFLTITCCCIYCCCCRGGSNKKYERDEARYDNKKMERKAKNEARRSERKERLDEIRRKYGLMKDEPYQRFDDA